MKKTISLLLTIAMLFSISTAVLAADIPQQNYPQRFWDVPKDHWAFNYIAELVNKGVLAGYEDGSFKPDSTVTRAEWAKIMVLAAGLPVNDNNVYFTDMGNHWANAYVNTAKDYLAAYTDGTFKPDQAAVREDVTVSMVKLKGYDVSNVDYSYLSQFTDVNSISNSLKAYVAVAVEKDLISGFDDGTFRGQNTLTRAEAATLLWRAFQYGNDNKVVDTPDIPVTTPPTTTPPTTITPPTQTDKPQQTPDNTTPDNTVETPEPTEEPEQTKPYKVDTLINAKISTPLQHVKYNNDIYYVENGSIYKVSISTGEKETIVESDSFTIDNERMTLSDFSIESIAYDKSNGGILVTGRYDTINPENIVDKYMLLEVINGEVNILTDKFYGMDRGNYVYRNYVISTLENGDIIDFHGNIVDKETFEEKGSIVAEKDLNGDRIVAYLTISDIVETSSDVYAINNSWNDYNGDVRMGGSFISKYSYSGETPSVLDIFDGYSIGIYNNGIVVNYKGTNGKYIEYMNFYGKTTKTIMPEDVEVKDKTPLNINNIGGGYKVGDASKVAAKDKLYVTNDENIIFYDNTAKAFRIISENN